MIICHFGLGIKCNFNDLLDNKSPIKVVQSPTRFSGGRS
jgi:hypothetical protein